MPARDRLVVVTGGPGTGKTSLVQALGRAGFAPASEVCRAIMQEEAATGGRALPWIDLDRFAERVLDREIALDDERGAKPGWTALDRAIPDIVGYLRLYGRPVPERLLRATRERRYGRRAFLAPCWPAIYVNDAERYETLDQARRVGDAVADAYRTCGYELVTLPCVPVAERVRFVLETAVPDGLSVENG